MHSPNWYSQPTPHENKKITQYQTTLYITVLDKHENLSKILRCGEDIFEISIRKQHKGHNGHSSASLPLLIPTLLVRPSWVLYKSLYSNISINTNITIITDVSGSKYRLDGPIKM